MGKIDIEDSYIETSETYHQGIALSEYNGVYSIAAVNESKAGKKFLQWIFPKLAEGAAKKEIPWQVRMGDAKKAAQILQQYSDMLKKIGDEQVNDTPF